MSFDSIPAGPAPVARLRYRVVVRHELLEIADALRALAASGLHFTESAYDRERYERLTQLALRLGGLAAGCDAGALEPLYLGDAGYVTPKLDVRMAVFRGDSLLLVRERADGRWAMPGGYVDIGDTPSQAAERETLEEAGLSVRGRRLIGVFDRRLRPEAPPHLFHIIKLVFLGELVDADAEPRAGSEATAAAFHPLDALPDLSLGRTLPLHVREALRVRSDPNALPHFD
jgi:ADP-ribose pyrophosphatase YjhB (NUDIX family)